MSFDAITSIAQAEDAAKVAVSYARAQAKQMEADAEVSGQEAIRTALAKAEDELKKLREQSDIRATENAAKFSGKLENKKAVLQAAAEARMGKAAELIAERIVNG
ncbi:MAG: hypothetical protein Q4F31_03185 [Eubacteriales bacterium]|nr:hypothetical protein [Eubacteriales bacterium]